MLKKVFTFLTALTLCMTGGCKTSSPAEARPEIPDAPLYDKDKYDYTAEAADKSALSKTLYQTNSYYREEIDITVDEVMLYGQGYDKIEGQIQSWKNKGKKVSFMIPIGRDDESFYVGGEYDRIKTGTLIPHDDLMQKDRNGNIVWHNPGITPYVTPSAGFSDYIADYAIKAIGAGAENVFIEEPDFWKKSGYEAYFINEYVKKFGGYERPHSSSDALKRTDELKAEIYVKAMDNISSKIKAAKQTAKVYICTHSASNYMHHQIVADNAAIINLKNIDGLVAQAWSDTSSAPVTFDGVKNAKKVFEYGYKEYSELINYVRGTGKEVFTLTDPSSDSPDLADTPEAKAYYKLNVAAQFLNPRVNAFEIFPWPDRCYEKADERYKSLMDGIFTVMNCAENHYTQALTGSAGVGFVNSYSAITNDNISYAKDTQTGIALSLIGKGIPLEILTLENMSDEYLKGIKVLILSYDQIKPLQKKYSQSIADWVKKGGTLLYIGDDTNAHNADYQWKREGFLSARQQLFAMLGLNADKTVTGQKVSFKSGKGKVLYYKVPPASFTLSAAHRETLYAALGDAFELRGERVKYTDNMQSVKGIYGKDDVTINTYKTFDKPLQLEGTFVDLLSDDYSVKVNPQISADSVAIYAQIKTLRFAEPACIFANGSTEIMEATYDTTKITISGHKGSLTKCVFYTPDKMTPTVRVFRSDEVEIKNLVVRFSEDSHTLYVEFPANFTGARVEVKWSAI